MNDPDFEFDAALAKKVDELEAKCAEVTAYLELAKSIKFTGRIPTVSKVGCMPFDDFMEYAREHWNCYSDPQTATYLRAIEKFIPKEKDTFELEDLAPMLEVFKELTDEEVKYTYKLDVYYQLIASMQEYEYSSEIVQKAVRILYEHVVQYNKKKENDVEITPQFFARYTASSFLCGDVSIINKRNYGEDSCNFIAHAIAFYGGYDINDL